MPKLLESTTAKTEGAFYLRPLRSMVTTRKPKSLVDVCRPAMKKFATRARLLHILMSFPLPEHVFRNDFDTVCLAEYNELIELYMVAASIINER